MKSRILLLIGLIFQLSCENKAPDKDNSTKFSFSADSTFVRSFNTDNLKEIKYLGDFTIGDDEFYSLIKPKMKFYNLKDFEISSSVNGKIILTTQPKDMELDGELKLIYLSTFDKEGNPISSLRIAKFAQVSDANVLETGKLVGNSITRRTRALSVNEDGSLREVDYEEKFRIKEDGVIIK